jgi:hypothetical protein
VSKIVGPRSASGILNREQAISMADGYAEIFDGDSFVVLEYASVPPTEYDVQIATSRDVVGTTPHLIYRTP